IAVYRTTSIGAALTVWLIGAGGCQNRGPLAPSPVILPDAVSVSVGEAQTFTVLNASVLSFTVSSDAADWHQLIRLANTTESIVVRAVALEPTSGGYVYIAANIGIGRSPLVAAMAIGR